MSDMETTENIRAVPAPTSVDSREDEANIGGLPGSIPDADTSLTAALDRAITYPSPWQIEINGSTQQGAVALMELVRAAEMLYIAALNGALDGPEDVEFEQYERARAKVVAALEAERHPYVVRCEDGGYDSRWTNYQAALDHASLIGGYVDAPAWHEDAL